MPKRSTVRKTAKPLTDKYKNVTKVELFPCKWSREEDLLQADKALKRDSVKQHVTPTTSAFVPVETEQICDSFDHKEKTDSRLIQNNLKENKTRSKLRSYTVSQQDCCKNSKEPIRRQDSFVHSQRKCIGTDGEDKEEEDDDEGSEELEGQAAQEADLPSDGFTKSSQQPIACTYNGCNTRFSYRHSLYAHIRSVHEKVRRRCENCGKSQSYVHYWAHTKKCVRKGKLKYFCTYEKCNMGFITKEDRASHEKKHKLLAKCPMKNCSKYLWPKNLRQHLRTVHQKVQKQCDYCLKLVSYRNYGHFKRCAAKY